MFFFSFFQHQNETKAYCNRFTKLKIDQAVNLLNHFAKLLIMVNDEHEIDEREVFTFNISLLYEKYSNLTQSSINQIREYIS